MQIFKKSLSYNSPKSYVSISSDDADEEKFLRAKVKTPTDQLVNGNIHTPESRADSPQGVVGYTMANSIGRIAVNSIIDPYEPDERHENSMKISVDKQIGDDAKSRGEENLTIIEKVKEYFLANAKGKSNIIANMEKNVRPKFEFFIKYLWVFLNKKNELIFPGGWEDNDVEDFMSHIFAGITINELNMQINNKATLSIDNFLTIVGLKEVVFNSVKHFFEEEIAAKQLDDYQNIKSAIDSNGFTELLSSINNFQMRHLNFFQKIKNLRIKGFDSKKYSDVNVKEKMNSQEDQQLLELLDQDLTAATLESKFPGISLKELKSKAATLGFDETQDLTSGEASILRDYAMSHVDVKHIMEYFPFRSQLYIEKEMVKINPNRRRTVFENKMDELLYLASWYSSDNFGRSARTRRDVSAEKRAQAEKPDIIKRKTNESARIARRERATHMHQLRKEKEARKSDILRKRKYRITIRSSKKPRMAEILQQESDYFQSVTGDGTLVELGEKRKRRKFSPIIIEDQPKREKKPTVSKSPEKSSSVEKSASPKLEIKDITLEMASSLKDNPFFPDSIKSDTMIPLHSRELFNFDSKAGYYAFPKLNISFDSHSILSPGDDFAYVDRTAYSIIANHIKKYSSLPSSFPSLLVEYDNELVLNPSNEVKIRFLLYPDRSESYVLAAPKSDELDPIEEIQKLFQIHYSLYFSHSKLFKDQILSFCKTIDDSVSNNNFDQFMSVIDKWNYLMLKLSPNPISKKKPDDINSKLRQYLKRKRFNEKSFNIENFYSEILYSSPFKTRKRGRPRKVDRESEKIVKEEVKETKVEKPNVMNISSLLKFEDNSTPSPSSEKPSKNVDLPDSYRYDFIQRLKEKKAISRYCLQQILLRVYSRVVSIDSRKLRSYKAFTAEVYGELLPSFISEVLEKVDLRPNLRFYDLGSGVGNAVFQAALEFGAISGGCEVMRHASNLTKSQEILMQKHLSFFGVRNLDVHFALHQSFVDNENVKRAVINSDVLLINNYLFDGELNAAVGRLLYGIKPGTLIISLKNFISPRYKASNDKTIFDYLKVEKHEMSRFFSVSWTANKVPYYISEVQEKICEEYLN